MNEKNLVDVSNQSVGEEGVTTWDLPSGTAEVNVDTVNKCMYHFKFKVDKGNKTSISGGVLTFKLSPGFVGPTSSIPDFTYTPASGEGVWNFGTLDRDTPFKTLEFDSLYTGNANVDIFLSVGATYTGGSISINKPDKETEQKCPTTNPCCEACNANMFVEFPTTPCDDYVEKVVTPVLDPKGRRLSVHLDMPPVCHKKDVVVGIFVTEVLVDGTEQAVAHKIIRRPAIGNTNVCVDDRNCDCVDFMIDDTVATICKPRLFRVRTKAHYVDKTTDVQQCQCDACTRP